MAELHGNAFFPGVKQIESCSATLCHGITPSTFTLTIAPQSGVISEGGMLVLSFGNVRIPFAGCKVDSASIQRQNGNIVSLAILDRRWRWRDMGRISGGYNLRTEDGKIIKNEKRLRAAAGDAIDNTERTPQQLATLCLKAMGESRFDVSRLPNDARPTVEWDYDNPAQELAKLVEDLGCRVVLGLNGLVSIWPVGVGKPVPNGPVMDDSATIDPPERPDAVTIVTARVRYQADFALEPVGLDKDEKIKPIDDLSYKPTAGWETVDREEFLEVSDATLRKLAQKSVFKWYRILIPAPETGLSFTLPGYGKIKRLAQFLPIETEQVDTVTDEDGVKRNKDAQVFGVWFNEQDGTVENTAAKLVPLNGDLDKTLVTVGFDIDTEKGIVKFSEPVVALDQSHGAGNDIAKKPTLVLRTAVSVKGELTRSWQRYERTRKNRGRKFGTQNRYILHDEIVPTARTDYDANYNVKGTTDNHGEVNKECDYYLDLIDREYQLGNPQTVRYAGLFAVNLDGAIQRVTWSITGSGTTTTVSRNEDNGGPTTLPYKLRRKSEKERELTGLKDKLTGQQLKRNVRKAGNA